MQQLQANGRSAPAETAVAGPAQTAVAPAPAPAPSAGPTGPPDDALLAAVAAGTALVKAFRTHGHLAAHLDPLGSEPVGDPALEPESLGLTLE